MHILNKLSTSKVYKALSDVFSNCKVYKSVSDKETLSDTFRKEKIYLSN